MTASFTYDSVFQSWLFTIYCRPYVRQFICCPFATLYDQYTAKGTGNRYNYERHFNGVLHGLQASAYQPQPAHLIFTFWWSNPNVAIILCYKWNTMLIFLANVLPAYSEMALKWLLCTYYTHDDVAMAYSMLKLKHARETKSVWK